jgi:hypothetical protein
MKIIDKDTFFEITKKFALVPYSQTRGIYEMHALSGVGRIIFFVNDIENPTIACMGFVKKCLGLKMLIIEGECYAEAPDFENEKKIHRYFTALREFYRELKSMNYDMIEIQSNVAYDFRYEIALRQAGFLRPVGQFSMPMTKIVDLTSEISYDENWRRFIRKSLRNDLKMEVIHEISPKDCADFIELQNALNERKKLSVNFSAAQIQALCSDKNFQLFFALYGEQRVAALIVCKDKNKRRVHLNNVASNALALRTFASFFIYNELINYLKKAGYKSFDLEKLVPAEDGVNSVFKFKDGIKGKYEVLNGEWAWYKKNSYRPAMYFIKKYLMKKREL